MKSFIIICLVLIIAGSAIYFLFFKEKSAPVPALDNSFFPIANSVPSPHVADIKEVTIPTTEGNEIVVRNFASETRQTGNGIYEIQHRDDTDFVIMYALDAKRFDIVLLNKNLGAVQQKAEKAFLEILGISEEEACMLSVILGVPYSYSPDFAGNNYLLSFCPGGISF